MWRMAVAVILVVSLGLGAGVVRAQAPYYAGKSIEILVPFSPGGAVDVTSRFLAPFLERHVAGRPGITIRNMPGGGSMLGASFFAANARPDGLMLMCTTSTTVFPWMFGHPGARGYDLRRMRAVFTLPMGPVVYTSPRTGVRRPADLLRPGEPLVYGGISAIGTDLPMLLAIELLRLPVRVVLGFPGRGPIRIAFERGETNLDVQFTPVYLTQVVPLVRAGKAIPLFTGGFPNERGELVRRDPVVSDLPSVFEVYREMHGRRPMGVRWRAYEATANLTFPSGFMCWAPDVVPQAALQALYEAVGPINADPEFRELSRRVTGGYSLSRGDQVEPTIRRAMQPTLDVRRFITDLLRDRYDVRF